MSPGVCEFMKCPEFAIPARTVNQIPCDARFVEIDSLLSTSRLDPKPIIPLKLTFSLTLPPPLSLSLSGHAGGNASAWSCSDVLFSSILFSKLVGCSPKGHVPINSNYSFFCNKFASFARGRLLADILCAGQRDTLQLVTPLASQPTSDRLPHPTSWTDLLTRPQINKNNENPRTCVVLLLLASCPSPRDGLLGPARDAYGDPQKRPAKVSQ